MTITANSNRVIWIEGAPPRPLCDVPWLGTSVVLSNGRVNFCCFSSVVVGNVNEEPFEKVWNGTAMQEIRRSLTERRLPPQCQSTSCPIYRGDKLHYLLGRMEGYNRFEVSGSHDPHQHVRERLQGSGIRMKGTNLQAGDTAEVRIELCYRGALVLADLFIAIQPPNGANRFLPNCEEYAVPFLAEVGLNEHGSPLQLVSSVSGEHLKTAGKYQICAALFQRDSNPNLLSNCYWSDSKHLIVN